MVSKSFHIMESVKDYVYILTNPSFREDWVKIGKSSRLVDVRSKEPDNTAVPLPFEVYATLYTSKFDKAEKQNNSVAYKAQSISVITESSGGSCARQIQSSLFF